jgi:hypothetical protein
MRGIAPLLVGVLAACVMAGPGSADGGPLRLSADRAGGVSNDVGTAIPQGRQDGRYIARLEWVSPHGEQPGTLAEYLQVHPYTHGQFYSPASIGGPRIAVPVRMEPPLTVSDISILVDATLYPQIAGRLSQYVNDLWAEGHTVYVEAISGGSPADIKQWIAQRYQCDTRGVILIGDITAAWAEVSGDTFPCDLYYMDLDGNWEDQDHDGDFEVHTAGTGDEGPEVYVARMDAHTLDWAREDRMINDYLDKVHAYRKGQLTQPRRAMEYVEEDWWDMDVFQRYIYGANVVRHDLGYETTGADYLNQMDLGWHSVQVCAHSWSGGHAFGRRPTEAATYAHVYVYSPTSRPARLGFGSDDGIRAWLNGSMILDKDVYRGWTPDQNKVNVTLNAGWNRLLCKVSQAGGSYAFSARFLDIGYPLDDLRYQVNNPAAHGEEAQYIRGWLLNGFHQDIPDRFWSYISTNYLGVSESGINPQEGEVDGGATWTRYDAPFAYVDLGRHCDDADYGVCYAFVRIYADAAKSCQLWIGYDDGARVWLNGAKIVDDNRYGSYYPEWKKRDVSLKAGENRMLVKVTEWMGEHGFSARFSNADGSPVPGLSYDPTPGPVTYIGVWLLNGPYANEDQSTRLKSDYLGGESSAAPSEGDAAPMGTWERSVDDGYPFDIARHYDHGDSVDSQMIQDRDPPVLFYNLFACGPGRFTDTDYLAGSYIFNTTWGLITVASSKSGSMLNFDDYTRPLGEGKTVGEAFREWFDAQSPYEQWEREWYYGMILNGDPTLRVVRP